MNVTTNEKNIMYKLVYQENILFKSFKNYL